MRSNVTPRLPRIPISRARVRTNNSMSVQHTGRFPRPLRLVAVFTVVILVASGLSGCILLAGADRELEAFATYARALPGVIDVTAMESGPTNPQSHFSDHTDALATVVIDKSVWRARLLPIADAIYRSYSAAKTSPRITFYISLYADGNRVELGDDLAENHRDVAALLDGTTVDGVTWLTIAGPRSADQTQMIVGRAAGTDIDPFMKVWMTRSLNLFPKGQLTVTTAQSRSPDAYSVHRPGSPADGRVSDRTVIVPKVEALESLPLRWLVELDALPRAAGYTVTAHLSRPAITDNTQRGPFSETMVSIPDVSSLSAVESTLRASASISDSDKLRFDYGKVSIVSTGKANLPLRALLSLITGDAALLSIDVDDGYLYVTTSSLDAVRRLLDRASTVPGTDSARLWVFRPADGEGDSGISLKQIAVEGALFSTVRRVLPSVDQLVHDAKSYYLYIILGSDVKVEFGWTAWDAHLSKLAIDTLRDSLLVTGVRLELQFDGKRQPDDSQRGDLDVFITPADPLVAGDFEARDINWHPDNSAETRRYVAQILADWNRVSR